MININFIRGKKYPLLLFLFLSLFIQCQSNIESVSVNVSLLKPVKNVKSLSGFLHYTNINKLEESIKQLKPKYWRIGTFYKSPDDIKLLRKYNITPVVVISDLYSYPGKKNNKDWPHPLKTDKLESLVKDLYSQLGTTVIYDIWNEPYHQAASGDFDQDEFYKIFKKANDLIRSQPGGKNAIITGPSFDHYNEKEMEGFLKYCNDNGIVINVLNWHEWRSGEELKDLNKDMDRLKNVILPKYPNVKVDKIMLYEIINQWIQFSPSEILQVFKILEENNIDGACKGCWAESNGVSNCENSLNGLLDQNGRPRAAWWGYKYYVQSTTNRVKSVTNFSNLISFASYSTNSVSIVLANNSENNILNTGLVVNDTNSLKFLKNLKNVKIKIFEIPDTGERELVNPLPILSKTVKVSKNIFFNIPVMKPKTVYYMIFEK